MIAPEPAPGINKQTSLLILLRNNLLACVLIFTALEFWRPYFFLTDDNLDGCLPLFTEIGHNLLSGHSPFISEHLFGGGYNWLRDPSAFVWHPIYLAVSLLAGTPFHNAIIDVDAFALYLITAAGFVALAHYLRREMALNVTDGWITFYTLSFTFTVLALTTGASWMTFLGSYSALPWLTLGILQKRIRWGILIVALFSMHELLGGHPEPMVSNSIFLSLFALGMSISGRSWLPLANWLVGYAIAVVIILPLLIPMLEGFATSYRAGGVTLTDMQNNNVPFPQFIPSIFLGMLLWIINTHDHPYTTYTLAFGSSAAAWCLFPAAVSRAKWRPMEVLIVLLLLFGVLLICRPVWVSEIMLRLPFFRSMRWPFREFVQFQFFMHLFLLVRPPGLQPILRDYSAFFGTLLLIISMALYPLPPTFNAMTWDRELVLTGGADRYWAQVRTLLKPTDRIAVLIPLDLYVDERFEEPYSLLGSYDYAVLANVVNAWGYSQTFPTDQVYTKTVAFYPFGAYRPKQKAALIAERPDLKFITLESLNPLRITLSSRDGPTIDLTPYVPKRISRPLSVPSLDPAEVQDKNVVPKD